MISWYFNRHFQAIPKQSTDRNLLDATETQKISGILSHSKIRNQSNKLGADSELENLKNVTSTQLNKRSSDIAFPTKNLTFLSVNRPNRP